MTLSYLLEKEFKIFLRTPLLIGLTLFYPAITLLILPWAINMEVKDVKVAIYDQSQSVYSQRLADKIDASNTFIVKEEATSHAEGLERIDRKSIDILLSIPENFARQMELHESPELLISANAVDGTQATISTAYLQLLINQYAKEVAEEQKASVRAQSDVEINTAYRYNKEMSFKTFMLPAFIVLLITLVCGVMAALNVVQEKDTGTIYQINVTPVSKSTFVFSKLITFWITGIIIFFTSIALVGIIYALWPQGSILTLFVVNFAFIIIVTAMGIIISNISRTIQQAMMLMIFCILILLIISGLFASVRSMPRWAQFVAFANPVTYTIDATRAVYLKAASFLDIWKELVALGIFMVVMNVLAIFTYRKVD